MIVVMFFKRFGSFVDNLFGRTHAEAKTTGKNGAHAPAKKRGTFSELRDAPKGGTLRETFEGMYGPPPDKAPIKAKVEAWDLPGAPEKSIEETLYDQHLRDIAEEQNRQAELMYEDERKQKEPRTPIEHFLAGAMTPVVSSNVAWIQYSREESWLYIGFKNGGVYGYEGVSVSEAESLFNTGSKGSWVWDNLRVRGTVFGHKKPYFFMDALSNVGSWTSGPSYEPRYHKNEKWREEHGAIPPSGIVPESWHGANGPYPGWFSPEKPA